MDTSRRHQIDATRVGIAISESLEILGLALPYSSDDVEQAYRRAAKTMHPDQGGNPQQFIQLQRAYEEALAQLETPQPRPQLQSPRRPHTQGRIRGTAKVHIPQPRRKSRLKYFAFLLGGLGVSIAFFLSNTSDWFRSSLDESYTLDLLEKLGARFQHNPWGTMVLLSDTPVSDEDLRPLNKLTHIVHLDLHGTNITDAAIPFIIQCKSIRELDLSYTGITNESLLLLVHLPHLRSLWLDGTQVTLAGLEVLAGMPQLESLSLSDTSLTKEDLAQLQHLRYDALRNSRSDIGVSPANLPLYSPVQAILKEELLGSALRSSALQSAEATINDGKNRPSPTVQQKDEKSNQEDTFSYSASLPYSPSSLKELLMVSPRESTDLADMERIAEQPAEWKSIDWGLELSDSLPSIDTTTSIRAPSRPTGELPQGDLIHDLPVGLTKSEVVNTDRHYKQATPLPVKIRHPQFTPRRNRAIRHSPQIGITNSRSQRSAFSPIISPGSAIRRPTVGSGLSSKLGHHYPTFGNPWFRNTQANSHSISNPLPFSGFGPPALLFPGRTFSGINPTVPAWMGAKHASPLPTGALPNFWGTNPAPVISPKQQPPQAYGESESGWDVNRAAPKPPGEF